MHSILQNGARSTTRCEEATMAANMRALGAVLAVSGVAVVLAVLLITQSDLHGESVLAQKPKHVMAKPMPGAKMIQYLKSDGDVSKPLKPRLHALSMQQIMDADSQNVDDLGADFGGVRQIAIGPDGLTDEGSTADEQLLNALDRTDAVDKDVMDAVDARHMVQRNKLLNLGRAKHDMAYDAEKADAKGVEALGRAADRQPSFKMVQGDDSHMSDVRVHHSDFHALDIAKASDDSSNDDSSLAQMDLGEEGSAEMMADPSHPMLAPKPESKGIWVEPGSNKGYDSFALDSLQVQGSA